jgi:hypothetical protein
MCLLPVQWRIEGVPQIGFLGASGSLTTTCSFGVYVRCAEADRGKPFLVVVITAIAEVLRLADIQRNGRIALVSAKDIIAG